LSGKDPYPYVDNLNPLVTPFYGLQTEFPTNDANIVNIYAQDTPKYAFRTAAFERISDMDMRHNFRMYITVKYSDDSVYSIAHWDWDVRYSMYNLFPGQDWYAFDENAGVHAEGGWVRSNSGPLTTKSKSFFTETSISLVT
jgi:hypothetical protein